MPDETARVDEEMIRRVADAVFAAAPDGSRVFLLGHVHPGDLVRPTDIDLLVIEPTLEDPGGEISRLNKAIHEAVKPLLSVDVTVYSQADAEKWRGVNAHVLHLALTRARELAPDGG